jgi:Autographiviridae endonuclease VII
MLLLRLARRLLRAPKAARPGAPTSSPGRRQLQHPPAAGQTLSRAERARKRYAEDEDCRARRLASNRKWERTHREHVNEYKRLVRNVDPKFREKNRARLANGRRMAKYGLSPQDFARMLARQNGLCANCKIRPAETLCVDHCHETGMVRGLLCRKCNTGLGCFNDSPALMLKAVAYLYRHAAREIGARLAAWRAFISHLWQVPR